MKKIIRRWSPHFEEWEYTEFNTLREYCDWLLFELNNHTQFDEVYEEVNN
tara:strand:- start:43 stop:192 length:150 start_codon:yes stop_codon:yes gene_type:complete